MNVPLVEGEPVLIIRVDVGIRVRRAVVSSSVFNGVVQAREQKLGRNLRPLIAANEGITWCRGWAPDARDALLAAWNLYRSST